MFALSQFFDGGSLTNDHDGHMSSGRNAQKGAYRLAYLESFIIQKKRMKLDTEAKARKRWNQRQR